MAEVTLTEGSNQVVVTAVDGRHGMAQITRTIQRTVR
jgi:hypothetical protein